MPKSVTPDNAKLLPDRFDFNPEADMAPMVERLFGGKLGVVIPTVEQVREVAEAELTTLRYGIFVARHKLDLSGRQLTPRTVVALAALRNASTDATNAALDAADTTMERRLRKLVYPGQSYAAMERARVKLNELIEQIKHEVAAFEETVEPQPEYGIAEAWWQGPDYNHRKPNTVRAIVHLYDHKVDIEAIVYVVGQDREVVLRIFAATARLANPDPGDVTAWLHNHRSG